MTNDGLEIEDSTATQGMHVNYCSSPFAEVTMYHSRPMHCSSEAYPHMEL